MYLTGSLLNIFLFQEEGTHKADWLNNDTQDTKIYFGRSFLSCAVISRSFTMKSKFEWSCGVFILDRPSFAFAFVSMSPKWLLKCSSVIFPFSNMTVSLANHMLWYINIEHIKQCNYLVLIFTLNTTSKWFLSLWFEQLTNIQLSTMNMVNNFCSNISSVFFLWLLFSNVLLVHRMSWERTVRIALTLLSCSISLNPYILVLSFGFSVSEIA